MPQQEEWNALLQEARSTLSTGQPDDAFVRAFRALEMCYGWLVTKFELGDATQWRFARMVKELDEVDLIAPQECRWALHFASVRNPAAHAFGLGLTVNWVRHAVGRIERMCARFGTRVRHIMVRDIIAARPDETIGRFVRLMREDGISQFPVVRGEDVIGTLDEECIFSRVFEAPPAIGPDTTVEEVMKKEVLPWIEADETIEHARGRLLHRECPALLVREQGSLVGIVTKYDLLKQFV